DIEQSRAVIEAVSKRPSLWNKKLDSYKNRNVQNDGWTAIGSEVGLPTAEAKAVWKNLLNSYRTYRSKVKKSKHSGAGASEVYVPRWFAYEAMAFVEDTMEDANHQDT
uniref:Uncharacterized protein n=2 Tax=Anopheles arabiensis TaxID=7173 RepID=A0A182HWY6_ANOAR